VISRIVYRYSSKFPQIIGGIQFVEYLRGKNEVFTGPAESRPYTLFWNRPNYSRKGFQQTDANGFRYKGYNVALAKSSKRILCYGGSTTYSDHILKNPKECWPHLLEDALRESSKPFEVVNCGLNYGLTSELLSHLIFEGVHFSPDFVILHGPGNDSMPIAVGDETFDYRQTRKSKNLFPRFFEPALLNLSGFARVIYARMLRENTPVILEPANWPDAKIQNDRMMNSELIAFKSNVESFVDVCVSRGIKVILVDFVQNHTDQLELLRPGMSAGMVSIVERMNNQFEEMVGKYPNSILHVQLNSQDFGVSDFEDLCHLNKSGEQKKANLIFKSTVDFLSS
jgi:hypothetical protein